MDGHLVPRFAHQRSVVPAWNEVGDVDVVSLQSIEGISRHVLNVHHQHRPENKGEGKEGNAQTLQLVREKAHGTLAVVAGRREVSTEKEEQAHEVRLIQYHERRQRNLQSVLVRTFLFVCLFFFFFLKKEMQRKKKRKNRKGRQSQRRISLWQESKSHVARACEQEIF